MSDDVQNIESADFTAGDGELLFVPLGGSGEIGMNLNLFGCAGRWLMVDLGIGFTGDEVPGVDIMVPDISFIAERRDRLDGLVLTHAHEDHLGAVAYLWPRLRCPVYASPFAAAVLRRKLVEAGLCCSIRDRMQIADRAHRGDREIRLQVFLVVPAERAHPIFPLHAERPNENSIWFYAMDQKMNNKLVSNRIDSDWPHAASISNALSVIEARSKWERRDSRGEPTSQ